jgi:hypothetical protein
MAGELYASRAANQPLQTKKALFSREKGLSIFIQSSPGYGLREKEKKN